MTLQADPTCTADSSTELKRGSRRVGVAIYDIHGVVLLSDETGEGPVRDRSTKKGAGVF